MEVWPPSEPRKTRGRMPERRLGRRAARSPPPPICTYTAGVCLDADGRAVTGGSGATRTIRSAGRISRQRLIAFWRGAGRAVRGPVPNPAPVVWARPSLDAAGRSRTTVNALSPAAATPGRVSEIRPDRPRRGRHRGERPKPFIGYQDGRLVARAAARGDLFLPLVRRPRLVVVTDTVSTTAPLQGGVGGRRRRAVERSGDPSV